MQRLFPGADIYAITDDALSLGRGVEEVVDALLKAGVRLIQYREKEKLGGRMLEECLRLRAMTKEAGAAFIVNDHVDIAMLCKARLAIPKLALIMPSDLASGSRW